MPLLRDGQLPRMRWAMPSCSRGQRRVPSRRLRLAALPCSRSGPSRRRCRRASLLKPRRARALRTHPRRALAHRCRRCVLRREPPRPLSERRRPRPRRRLLPRRRRLPFQFPRTRHPLRLLQRPRFRQRLESADPSIRFSPAIRAFAQKDSPGRSFRTWWRIILLSTPKVWKRER